MSAIISGQHEIYYKCDWHEGCDKISERYLYDGRSTIEIEEIVRRKEHWYISVSSDKCYCPEHSPYNQKV